jgi:adenylate cyclase, class 2
MEIEVKVPVDDAGRYGRKAEELGYERIKPRHFEANTLYDYPNRPLSLSGCLLRVRETPDGALLTFKGKLVAHDRYKMRPEHETVCDNGGSLRTILENIGLRPFFRYEKYREEYRAPDAVLCLDEMPFGHFLELEGTPDGIERLAGVLKLDPDTFIRRSYADLYGEHCRKLGVPFGDILFPENHDDP